jgi:hypothetical protein
MFSGRQPRQDIKFFFPTFQGVTPSPFSGFYQTTSNTPKIGTELVPETSEVPHILTRRSSRENSIEGYTYVCKGTIYLRTQLLSTVSHVHFPVCKYASVKIYKHFVIYLLFNEDSTVEYSTMPVGTFMGNS